MALPGIVIQVGADTKDAVAALGGLGSQLERELSGVEKFTTGVNRAFVPAVAVLGGLAVAGVDAARAAAEDAQAADLLANSLRNTTGATDAQVASLEDWITAQGKALGVADDQLRPALQRLASASGSVAQAQKDAQIAMDLAAQTGVPVETAAKAIAKAYDGSTGALRKLVPGLDAAIVKSGDMSAIMGELGGKVDGAAQIVADSAQGGFARFQLALTETKESLGAALLPALDAIMPKVLEFAQWAQDNSDVLLKVIGAVAALAGVIVVLKGVIEAITIVQTALNVVMAMNPIMLVVLAVAALVAGFVLLYKNSETVRDIVQAVWAAIQTAIGAVVTWFQDTVLPAFTTAFDVLATIVRTWLGVYRFVWDSVWAIVEGFVAFFRDKVAPAFTKVLGIITGSFSDAIGAIRGLWEGLWAWFDGLGDRFLAIGTAIVEGIKNGIGNAWGAFTGWLGDKVGGLITSVKNMFGIASPSKVFAWLGQMIVAGWKTGLAGLSTVTDTALAGAKAGLDTIILGTTSPASASTAANGNGVLVSDEQVVRALRQIIARSDARNGFAAVVA